MYNRKIGERYKELSKLYNWQYKDFFIVVADSADSLVKEGQNLHHCVGGIYKELMAEGKTIILFLRKKDEPNKSFYTIELRGDTITQVYGYKDCNPTQEINKIMDRFKKDTLPKDTLLKAV